jgi:trigger factor
VIKSPLLRGFNVLVFLNINIEVIMQVHVESPSKLQRRLTITVPIQQWDVAFDKRISKITKTAKVKGFRPGNVPVAHIKQLYGDAARQEALSDVIQSSLYEAITQENLQPIGVPSVEPKTITPGMPIEYIATFEILPEIEKVNFEAKTLEKQLATISEEDVTRVIDKLCEQHITWRAVDRAAQEKDQVIVDFRGSIDDKVFPGGEAHDYPIIIGSKTMIPGFEEGLIDIKVGEEKVLKIVFPENYFSKEVAGKHAEFTVLAHKISEPELPIIDDKLIKKFGIQSGNLEELRAEIKKNLDREVVRLIKTKLKTKVFDLLVEQNTFDVPQTLIEQEAKRIHDELHPHHAGKDHGHSNEEMMTFNEPAKRNVMLGLLISAFVKQHNITPDKSRVHDHIIQIASAYEKPSEVIQWYQSDKRRLAEAEMYILEEQVMEKLLEGVNVIEKMLDYNTLVSG